jgi:REP element-mobilizing transposase RayT
MTFNPDIHRRRSIRLKDYDYSRNGAYFVTICTHNRDCCIERFAELRRIVDTQWQSIPERFSGVTLDEYVIMPNHIHGIMIISRDTPRGCPDSDHPNNRALARGAPTLGEVVGSFKSLCVTDWLKIIKAENIDVFGKFWQSNYYEHVIRNEAEMERVRQYIADNPLWWETDRENPDFSKPQIVQEESWMV